MPGEQHRIPSGTVTFLFSDVVGSTRLWAADPEAMSASLRIHDQIFNETIAKYEGHVFSTAGDSFAVAFARASAAVECAEAIQRSLREVDWGTWPALSVRIGLHQGEAEERDANYFGPTVNQAARVMAVAWTATKLGRATSDVTVRDPVVLTATLPRFLNLGDRSVLHVDIDNVAGEAGDYRLDLDIHGPVAAEADALSRSVKLAAHQRLSVSMPIRAVGVGTAPSGWATASST